MGTWGSTGGRQVPQAPCSFRAQPLFFATQTSPHGSSARPFIPLTKFFLHSNGTARVVAGSVRVHSCTRGPGRCLLAHPEGLPGVQCQPATKSVCVEPIAWWRPRNKNVLLQLAVSEPSGVPPDRGPLMPAQRYSPRHSSSSAPPPSPLRLWIQCEFRGSRMHQNQDTRFKVLVGAGIVGVRGVLRGGVRSLGLTEGDARARQAAFVPSPPTPITFFPRHISINFSKFLSLSEYCSPTMRCVNPLHPIPYRPTNAGSLFPRQPHGCCPRPAVPGDNLFI